VLCNEYDRSAGSAQAAAMFQASHRDFPPVSRCGSATHGISLSPLTVSILDARRQRVSSCYAADAAAVDASLAAYWHHPAAKICTSTDKLCSN